MLLTLSLAAMPSMSALGQQFQLHRQPVPASPSDDHQHTIRFPPKTRGTLAAKLESMRVLGGKPWGVMIPGMSAAIGRGTGHALHSVAAASGVADPPGETPLTITSRFHVGSITKTFTAALIMQLDASRRLSLDDPISRWIEYPNGEAITIAMLLGHTSGIPDFSELPGHAPHNTPHTSIALAASTAPLFPPGEDWSYSNTNYVILGRIAEIVTGSSWSHEVKTRFLDRLDLDDTYVWDGIERPATIKGSRLNCGMPHEPDCVMKPGFTIVPVTDGPDWKVAWAAGALVSTPNDLVRWIQELCCGNVLDAEHRALMTTPTPQSERKLALLPPFGKLRWRASGLGLFLYEVDGVGSGWGHEGNINGFVANVVAVPEAGMSVAVTSNFLQTDAFSSLGELVSLAGKIDEQSPRGAADAPVSDSQR